MNKVFTNLKKNILWNRNFLKGKGNNFHTTILKHKNQDLKVVSQFPDYVYTKQLQTDYCFKKKSELKVASFHIFINI